tara:strand:- start:338 stop:760 length:423 start_codon:yes stop_codon:yes gene_type:complete
MSQIISFSSDKEFASDLENLATKSGYNNRSRFIRDAVLYFADIKQRGELNDMPDDLIIEGHLIVYYQHGSDQKLMVSHSGILEVASYNHSSLKYSHSCVDVIQVKGNASNVRTVVEKLQNTGNVDKVTFTTAPMRNEGCC